MQSETDVLRKARLALEELESREDRLLVYDNAENEVFAHGVASGDPDATSVVLWTRVSTDAQVADGLFEVAA